MWLKSCSYYKTNLRPTYVSLSLDVDLKATVFDVNHVTDTLKAHIIGVFKNFISCQFLIKLT